MVVVSIPEMIGVQYLLLPVWEDSVFGSNGGGNIEGTLKTVDFDLILDVLR